MSIVAQVCVLCVALYPIYRIVCNHWSEDISEVRDVSWLFPSGRSLLSWRRLFWMTSHTGTSYKPMMCPPSRSHVPPRTPSAGSSMERVQHGGCRVRNPSVTDTCHKTLLYILNFTVNKSVHPLGKNKRNEIYRMHTRAADFLLLGVGHIIAT